jgi:hypothetical protein
MAGGAAKLPKWQARANLVPNRPQQISCQMKIFDRGKLHQDFSYFFFLTMPIPMVELRKRKGE